MSYNAEKFRRKNAGTPAGGQFDNRYHAEVDLELTLEEIEANREGSFEARPHPRSAAQVIDFWLNCEIPDPIINYCLDKSDGYTGSETGRQLVRCEMMTRDAHYFGNLVPAERDKILSFGVPFPNNKRFRPYDALEWHGVFGTAVPWREGQPQPDEWYT